MPKQLGLTYPTRCAILTFAWLLVAGSTRAADETWVEVRSAHFTVISNAGEKRARNMAWQFEQVDAVLKSVWPWATGNVERPVVIYGAKDERSMRMLAPQYWEGRGGGVKPTSVFLTAPDAHYISVRTDQQVDNIDTNPYRSSYWSYVALTLTSSIPHDLPLWYYRGLAEVFSNTIVRTKDVLVGPVVPWHLERLRDQPPLRLEVLFGVTRESPYMKDGDRMNEFDASAWALLHYLTFGNDGKNLALFNRFSVALGAGADAKGALAEAFGGLAAVEEGYRRYVSKTLYMYKQLDLDVNVDSKSFVARVLPASDADIAVARYHAASGRPIECRARLASAKASPPNGAVDEIEGLLLDRDGKRDEALAAYTRATELGGGSYYGEYRFASLSWPQAPDTKEPFPKMERSLRRAVELRPTFAPAHALLAAVLVQLDRASEGLPLAQRAVALDPTESFHQLTLARVLFRLGKRGEAIAPAQHARTLAKSAFDVNAAEQFLRVLQPK